MQEKEELKDCEEIVTAGAAELLGKTNYSQTQLPSTTSCQSSIQI